MNLQEIFAALEKVKHPETGRDIVSMKMVQGIEIEGDQICFDLVFDEAPKKDLVSTIRQECVAVIKSELGDHIKLDITDRLKGVSKETAPKEETKEPTINAKNIIAVASGKGGVGKSTVSVNLAVALAKTGAKVGLIDADIYGPSIPKMFGAEDARPHMRKEGDQELIVPHEKYGVKMLSIGFFVNPEDATVWRGPMASNALKQIMLQGDWGELDYFLIDLPPGTSDIHLTLVQSLAVTGAVIVSTPQDVALADVVKGVSMFTAKNVNVPILGLVENMAWFTPAELPDNKYYIFGKDGCKKLAKKLDVDILGEIPIVQSIREGGDSGVPVAVDQDSVTGRHFMDLAYNTVKSIQKRNANADPTQKVEVK